jgi:hypothetical protein
MNKNSEADRLRWKNWYYKTKGVGLFHGEKSNGRTFCNKIANMVNISDEITCSVCLRIKEKGRADGK